MEAANAPGVIPTPPAKQPILSRLFWFGVGGAFSVMLNIGPFHWLRTHAGLPDGIALAISLTCVTVIFSIWNYLVNFRTTRGWRECQVRYLAAVGFCYLLTYTIALTGIKQWGESNTIAYLIVAATQIGVSGVKFLLYHHWVYPRTPAGVTGA
jgi:putative flippase GtrA